MRQVVDRLATHFPSKLRSHITNIVREEFDALAGSRIRTYLPNLVEHGARTRLRDERDSSAPPRSPPTRSRPTPSIPS